MFFFNHKASDDAKIVTSIKEGLRDIFFSKVDPQRREAAMHLSAAMCSLWGLEWAVGGAKETKFLNLWLHLVAVVSKSCGIRCGGHVLVLAHMVHVRAATCACCYMCMLLHVRAATCACCYMCVLLHVRAATCACCYMCVLLHVRAATCACCYMRVLLHTHTHMVGTCLIK